MVDILLLYQNSTSGSFSKVTCIIKSESVSMNFLKNEFGFSFHVLFKYSWYTILFSCISKV